MVYQSDPVLEDASALVASLDGGEPPPKTLPSAGTSSSETPKRRVGANDRDPTVPDSDSWVVSDAVAAFLLEELLAAIENKLSGINVLARWIGVDQRVRVARTGQPVISDRRAGARLRLQARRGTAAGVSVETTLHDQKSDRLELVERLAERVCRRLTERADARRPQTGEFPVVFAPGVGGVLVHEVVGHALEADVVLADSSWLAGGDGSFLPKELTVLDDPRRGRVKWRFDDQAEEAKATPLLLKGRVAGNLHDRSTADRTGKPATGHGRRASFREPVLPRMGATFVAAGRLHPEEVINGLARGIYVRRMEAASTDTRTGGAVFRVTDADLIVRGRVDAPLNSFLLLVQGEEALASVDRIAGDLEFDSCIGTCHKDGQPLPISVGAPTFRIGLARVVT
jgi:predicted Zn-dependent protease